MKRLLRNLRSRVMANISPRSILRNVCTLLRISLPQKLLCARAHLEDLYVIMAGFEPSKTVTLQSVCQSSGFLDVDGWSCGGPRNDHRHLARAPSVWEQDLQHTAGQVAMTAAQERTHDSHRYRCYLPDGHLPCRRGGRTSRTAMVISSKRAAEGDDDTERLLLQKEMLYGAIRDLDFDFQTGKVDQKDYAELRQQLEREAVQILRQLDAADPLVALDHEIEQQVLALRRHSASTVCGAHRRSLLLVVALSLRWREFLSLLWASLEAVVSYDTARSIVDVDSKWIRIASAIGSPPYILWRWFWMGLICSVLMLGWLPRLGRAEGVGRIRGVIQREGQGLC